MSNTSEIYSSLIIENIIKEFLQRGEVPTLEQIEQEFNRIAAGQDLASSNFTSDEWKVSRRENSSATKYNSMNSEIHQDLSVLYKSLLDNSDRSVHLFSRWQARATSLETRLRGLESRIARLLTLTQDTSGFFSIVGDKFTDTKLIDLDRSTDVFINLQQNIITLDKTNQDSTKPERIFLNKLRSNQAVFRTITRNKIVSVTNLENTEPRFAFSDKNQFWKTSILTNEKVSPLTTELLLSLDSVITISRIEVFLHSSQNNSVMTVTPLVSLDGVNFSRIPVQNVANQGLAKVSFQFPETDAKFIKFIFEKSSPDYTDRNFYVYEFGAKEIALFQEVFDISGETFGKVISKPLSITKPDLSLVRFNKVALEVCEGISSETNINYFIAVAQDLEGEPSWLTNTGFSTSIDLAGEDQRLWFPITPLNRTEVDHTQVLDFASLSENEYTDISISYDRDGTTFISPAETYTLLSETEGAISTTTETATDQRYVFSDTNQRLLDLQVDLNTPIDLESITLWRNVGEKGIDQADTSKLVRGIQAGWEFEAPFYITFIEVKSPTGFTINVGNNPINIDDTTYTKVVGPDVLSPGIHKVKVHQDFWNPVEAELATLQELKAADILYPFNQKLIIEGYKYPDTWSASEEKVYPGVDRFAGIVLDKVSIFDFINNIASNNLTKFAVDTDIENAVTSPSYVFVVNCNTSRADFVNESFALEYNLTNQLYSYVALKTELRTKNSQLTPVLDEYRIKLGF